jgi:hypothetical protein
MLYKLALTGHQQTWQSSSRIKQQLRILAEAVSEYVPGIVFRWHGPAETRLGVQLCTVGVATRCQVRMLQAQAALCYPGPAPRNKQMHTAKQSYAVQSSGLVLLPVSLMQVLFVPHRSTSPSCEQYDSTGRTKAHSSVRAGSNFVQLRYQHSSSVDSGHKDSCPDISAWVSQVLSSEVRGEVSRGQVVHLFQTLTKLFHMIRATRRGKQSAHLPHRWQLLASLDQKLPQAIAVLAERTLFLTIAENVPLGERMHPPSALLLYSSALHAAPAAVRKEVLFDSGARSALEAILARCTKHKDFCSKAKFVSMTCKSLMLLHECNAQESEVRRAQAEFLSRLRTASMNQLDIEAIADLCALMAASGQRRISGGHEHGTLCWPV